jgi:serine protease Do
MDLLKTRRVALLAAIAALVIGLGWYAPCAPSAEPAPADLQAVRAMSRAVVAVASKVNPSVVSIYTTRMVNVPRMQPSPFGDLFGDLLPNPRTPQPQPEERQFRQSGMGSGFIIDAKKGYILTNNHVIDGAEDIKVRLTNRREFDGKLIGADSKTDLAIIQIKAPGLAALEFGDSDKLEVGEFVLAIGSPFGLRETVSLGIVSGKGRSGLGIEDYEDFIQTDAAINMGNSGGPLVNIEGKVVGVNTAILSRTGGSVGVGFAIPINMARSIIDQLIKTGKVTRGWLGVMIQDVTPEIAEQFNLEKPEGALISQVLDDTPADKAGLKAGDVVVEFNGNPVASMNRFRANVAATTPNSKVKLVVIRDGKRRNLTLTIGTLSDETVAAVPGQQGGSQSLGIKIQDLTPALARQLNVKAQAGVVVSEVDPAGPAAERGIKRGDVIEQVNRQAVKNVAEFDKALRGADLKKGVLLLVSDSDGSRFVVLRARD